MFLDAIFSLLEDGEWHDVTEIPEKAGLPEVKAEITIAFLAQYGFIELDDKKMKARAVKAVVNFMKRIRSLE